MTVRWRTVSMENRARSAAGPTQVFGTKTADGRCFVLIPKGLERDLGQSACLKGVQLVAQERPGHLAFGIAGLAPATNHQQSAAWFRKGRQTADCLAAHPGELQHLQCVGLIHKVEGTTPLMRRIE